MPEEPVQLFHDHHSHPLFYSAMRSGVDLSEVDNFEQAAQLISEASRPERLVVAHHWKSNAFAIPTDLLEQLPAVAIFNWSLHELKLNNAAMAYLREEYGPVVEKVSDQDWYENNLRLVLNWFAMLGGSPESLIDFYKHLESLGIESAEEMLLVNETEIQWFQETDLVDKTQFWAAPDTFEQLSVSAKQNVKGTKLFTDGAFGAWTAAISIPYNGQPKNTGTLIYTQSELNRTILRCAEMKRSIAIHAIGDVAIEQVITAFESFDSQSKFDLIRIEHAQLISRDQARRAKKLGITLSMQPNFNSDSKDYSDRLTEKFLHDNNPFRMLIDEVGFEPGIDLILGSDGMPHGFENAWHSVNEPVFESQRLSRIELTRGYAKNVS